MPAKRLTDTGAERFGDGFLGGEAGGDVGGGVGVAQAVFALGGEEDTVEEFYSKLFVGLADAIDYDDVCADADDHPAS